MKVSDVERFHNRVQLKNGILSTIYEEPNESTTQKSTVSRQEFSFITIPNSSKISEQEYKSENTFRRKTSLLRNN